ncbi:MAG TPA: hypothetical protein PK867_28740, partial [Pirellulales bacterium]|nr:hypothetical protein [Pirellulales bacterium]
MGVIAIAASRLSAAELFTALWLIAGGIFGIAGAAYDWAFFMDGRKARSIVGLIGRGRARIFYSVLGAAVFLGGVSMALGLIKDDVGRRRFARAQPVPP